MVDDGEQEEAWAEEKERGMDWRKRKDSYIEHELVVTRMMK